MKTSKPTMQAKFALIAIAFVWTLGVMATFVLTAASKEASLWQALGASCITGTILGIIGATIVGCNWDDLGLPR